MTPLLTLPVRKRHVFFIGGFDPRGAASHHATYRREAALASAVGGQTFGVSARTRTADRTSVWHVTSTGRETLVSHDVEAVDEADDGRAAGHGDHGCDTVYECLPWDAIVRRHWPRGPFRLIADLLGAYQLYVRTGTLRRGARLVPLPSLLSFLLPGAMLLATLAIGAAVAASSVWTVLALGGGELPAATAGVVAGSLSLLGGWAFEQRLQTGWIARILAFTGHLARGQVPGMEPCIDHMAALVARRLDDDTVDEVLLVGHSVGSNLCVSVAVRALRLRSQQLTEQANQDNPGRHDTLPTADISTATATATAAAAAAATEPLRREPVLSVLSLGNCFPLLGLLPSAVAFRDELVELANRTDVAWFDFSSPGDWGSFALVDPVVACVPDARAGLWPVMHSPRFHTLFAADEYERVRRNKRRLHLQYLMAGTLPGAYNYFAITAGPSTLTSRYAREPSP